MKWATNPLWILFLIFANVGFQFCKTINPNGTNEKNPIPKQIESKQNIPLTKELRLTYHAVWVAKENFELTESISLFGTGNQYTIQMTGDKEFVWLRLSSTDRENQSQFRYFFKDESQNPDVSYFVWGQKKCSVQVYRMAEGEVYLRWEGIHNGFLLVFESSTKKTESSKELAKSFHDLVLRSLEVY
ncbi:MAG: hypothetical protein ACO1NV_10540 [Leptospira bouyouniensis]|uniref:Uncharacterized protein n=1 Tax=Leptospira bouyouniensis TaxID=2484911 RepID=A0A7I0HXA2_9LEPT|nr:hypothetical protein [Leptospira bouyouniensis]TGK49757.1 hypothetical protein EHQ10_07870 [Leptospira bouyouniensis]TGL09492.1 hypothetical protein EHQ43_01035 [Leptospira bouyouniensis]TGM77942.1 hypothetical protein EHQ99_16540 [Leptospira bouyouniensis]